MLDSLHILARSRLFLLGLSLHLLELGLAGVLDFFLDLVLIGASVDVVALEAEVHDQLIDSIILLIFALQVVIHGAVLLGLRVRHDQRLRHCQVELGS